jgi:hypothetical protein
MRPCFVLTPSLQILAEFRTIDFEDPLFTAALGADERALGRTGSFAFSLVADSAFHTYLGRRLQ